MSPPVSADETAAGQDHGHQGGSHLGSSLTYPRSASVLGYCLLPLVLVSTLGIVVPLDGLFGYLLTSLSIMWCSYSSSSMFTIVGKSSQQHGMRPVTDSCRSHDFDEGSCRISYGTFLWQLWHYGHLQLSRHWTVGQGGWGSVRNEVDFEKHIGQIISTQQMAYDTMIVENMTFNYRSDIHTLSGDEPIGARQLISVWRKE
jgi:hypothetical protein